MAGPWRSTKLDAANEWRQIVTAYNMHGKLVVLANQMPALACSHAKAGGKCCACEDAADCELLALLKEARATNLPGLTAEESALVREHKAEIARGDK